jgi:hypothetical protein
MVRRAVPAGLALASFFTATGGDLPLSPYSDVVVVAVWTFGLLTYGWRFGRTSLWLFPLLLVVVAETASWLFFEPDPRISSMDQIGDDPGAIVLVLPLAMIVLGLAVLAKRRSRKAVPA